MNRRNLTGIGVAVFLAGAGGYGLLHWPREGEAPPPRAANAMRETAEAIRALEPVVAALQSPARRKAPPAPGRRTGPFVLERRRPPPPKTPEEKPAAPPPALKVTLILTAPGAGEGRAVVNGRMVKVGDVVAGWNVVGITADSVEFRRGARTLVRRVGEHAAGE